MAAVNCDDCGQALHVPLDVGALRLEYAKRKREMAQAALIIVVMLGGSFALASHVGGFLLSTAPLGWFAWSFIRFQRLKRYPAIRTSL